jgi:hypothetical protein
MVIRRIREAAGGALCKPKALKRRKGVFLCPFGSSLRGNSRVYYRVEFFESPVSVSWVLGWAIGLPKIARKVANPR